MTLPGSVNFAKVSAGDTFAIYTNEASTATPGLNAPTVTDSAYNLSTKASSQKKT